MPLDEYYAFRGHLVDALVRDLMGPESEFEEILEDPVTRYAVGILFPLESGTVDPSQDVDQIDEDEETQAADPVVALAHVRYPSSAGMTCAVDTRAASLINVTVSAARYTLVDAPAPAPAPAEGAAPQPRGSEHRRSWRRQPLSIDPCALDITKPRHDYIDLTPDGLKLFYRIRRADSAGIVAVSLVVLNTRPELRGGLRDADCFYQPQIAVTAPGVQGAFAERPTSGLIGNDEDLRSYKLLYRHAREFAVGHGCSVEWDTVPGRSDRASAVRTSFIPTFDLRLADSNPAIDLDVLGIKYLAGRNRADIIRGLEKLCEGYESWIDERSREAVALSDPLAATAQEHLQVCLEAAARMRCSVAVLNRDDQVWRAFRLMNRAMLQQMARKVWLQRGKPVGGPQETDEHRWRPFQLAFILLCLEGIADGKHPDRDLADLLWFPTGGGKTEAYLGLIAFTVFLRRLRRPDAGGVVAVMRYTLRFLTLQQFERAALMICCCEMLRRQDSASLGRDPVSIGLWVGQGATPNTLDDAAEALDRLRKNRTLEQGSPCQLRSCPWCGSPMDANNYYIEEGKTRLVATCRQRDCAFESGLPVYVVDQDIYNYRPTLLIATVDKFASLPWREEAADLFNLATNKHSAQLRPELIIQDELHLISGPLGTLVGLYETAVDLLSTQDGVRPKIIASTATIRRAGHQAASLFNRRIRQFPPPGIDARDSHFAVEAEPDRKGTRLYVGLMAPGVSHSTLMIRAYSALLQNAQDIPASEAVKDPYWTLVGYFNSLRVLGGARMQVQDDIGDRMNLLARRSGTDRREIDERIELTSREPHSEIPAHLKHMAVSHPDPAALDVILATNMISVGVDIDRFGLMAVMGQPQSTSEYIQATSRVGRRFPGLVLAVLNAARSRDRSHYESFVAYHSALYRQVEATSVTPFSARARDRGLHAVLVALTRLMLPEFRPNESAALIAGRRDRVESIKQVILDRVREVAPTEYDAAADQLDRIIAAWVKRAEENPSLVYRDYKRPTSALLIEASREEPEWDEHFRTLWSLRDVDKTCVLYEVRDLRREQQARFGPDESAEGGV